MFFVGELGLKPKHLFKHIIYDEICRVLLRINKSHYNRDVGIRRN